MVRILTVCGNGMGTSTIIKIKIKGMCKELGVDCLVESCSAGESASFMQNSDIIVTTPEWVKLMRIPADKKVNALKNLMDTNDLKQKLTELL